MISDDVISHADWFLFSLRFRDVPYGVCVHGQFDVEAYTPTLRDVFEINHASFPVNAVPKRQADFLAGRLVAIVAIGKNLPLPIGTNKAPVWPSGLNGSITHSHGQCAAVVAQDDILCGIDIERIASGTAFDAILHHCLSPQERDWVGKGHDDMPQNVLATLIFSAKETIFKALSSTVGGFFGFDCAALVAIDKDRRLKFHLTKALHHTLPKGFEISIAYELIDGFVLTEVQIPRSLLIEAHAQ